MDATRRPVLSGSGKCRSRSVTPTGVSAPGSRPAPCVPLRVGILGGGQLARMTADAARVLGLETVVLDPDTDAPAGQVTRQVVGPLEPHDALARFARQIDVATLENEFVHRGALEYLAEHGVMVRPSLHTFGVIMDKLHQRAHMDAAGLSPTPYAPIESPDDVPAFAAQHGWPVVLKGIAEGIAHKTEAGLVRLDLRDAAALLAAYREMGSPAKVVVQPFMRGRAEAIAGLTRSSDTGPVLIAGLGGIYAEALREVVMWAVPASRQTIESKLALSALGRVLASPRWQGDKAQRQYVDALMGLQSLAQWAGDRLGAVDINPIVLSESGAVAVDGLVIASTAAADSD